MSDSNTLRKKITSRKRKYEEKQTQKPLTFVSHTSYPVKDFEKRIRFMKQEMDANYQLRLQQQHEAIIRDLDVSDIQDRLYEKGYFSSDEYEWANASNKSCRVNRTRDLLSYLIQFGNNAKYDIFVDSLEKDYDWLWMKLKMDSTEV